MGVLKMLKYTFTSQIKCDECGDVIVNGAYKKPDRYTTVNGKFTVIPSVTNVGVGFLNTMVYGLKDKVICDSCKARAKADAKFAKVLEDNSKKWDEIIAQEKAENAEMEALQKENLRMENELLKQKLKKESQASRPVANQNIPNTRRANNFCSGCGNALKPNAGFCTG